MKVPEKVCTGGLGAKPRQVQQGSEEGHRRFREAWVHSQFRFNRVLKKVPAQSQVRFNRVPEKVPEKVYWKPWCRRGFGAEPGQVQQGSGVWEALVQSLVRSTGFRRRFRRRSARLWCRARSGSTGEKVPEKVRFNRICGHLTHGNPAEVFPALCFAARHRKICKNKPLRLLGIPPKLVLKGWQRLAVALLGVAPGS